MLCSVLCSILAYAVVRWSRYVLQLTIIKLPCTQVPNRSLLRPLELDSFLGYRSRRVDGVSRDLKETARTYSYQSKHRKRREKEAYG